MGISEVQRGAVAERVQANIKRIRLDRGMTGAQLADLLGALGRPLLPTAVNKIEKGTRRVDVDDLTAFALALNTTPNRLLLSDPNERDHQLELAPCVTVHGFQAWTWANGSQVLLGSGNALGWGDATFGQVQRDYLRHAQPPAQHPAQDAADDVRGRIGAFLSWVDQYVRETKEAREGEDKEPVPVDHLILHAEEMRQSLRRLQAQIAQMLADSPLADQPEYGEAFFASVEVHEQTVSRVMAARERVHNAQEVYAVEEVRAHEVKQRLFAAQAALSVAQKSGHAEKISDLDSDVAMLGMHYDHAMSEQLAARKRASQAETALEKAQAELYELRRLMLIRNMVPPHLPPALGYIDNLHPTDEIAKQVRDLKDRLNQMRLMEQLAAASTALDG